MNATASNHDPAEIARFDDIAQRWWDPRGEFRPLHVLNPVRLDYIDEQASLRGKRVLDVGCGGGIFSEAMAKRGAQVTGIDLAPQTIEIAELHALESQLSIRYVREVGRNARGSFSRRLRNRDLHGNAGARARTCQRAARFARPGAPGGDIFVSTLNRNLKSYLLAVMGAEYVLNMLPRGTHSYERFIKPSELSRWARGTDSSASWMSPGWPMTRSNTPPAATATWA